MTVIKYAHIRPNLSPNSGGYTIAYLQPNDNERGVLYSIARCNPKDNFNKALGRKIAAGRLNSGIANIEYVPTRAKKYRNIVKVVVKAADASIFAEKILNKVSKK